ncbi:MAG: DNA polymerase ligase N-terminal domain-containing protein [Gemmatales bacterium]
MPRYVILEHDWNGVHYDLMLERGESLATWRLESLLMPGTQPAIKLTDHRTAYLEYEGELSGNRGSVRRVAEGEYTAALITDRCWIVELQRNMSGKVTLRHETLDRWQLQWHALC